MDTPIAPAVPTAAAPAAAPAQAAPKKPGRSMAKRMKDEIDASRKVRDELVEGPWKDNVQYRIGKPYSKESDEPRVSVPVDWSYTKAKEAGLFSQVPAVNLTAKSDRYKDAVPVVQTEVNDVLKNQVKVGVAMEESLADMINAAGMCGVITGVIATYRDVDQPTIDISMLSPEEQALATAQGAIPTTKVKQRVDCKLFAKRLSPSQLLWSKRFKGSDFDDADWVGYDDCYTWAEALREFGRTADRPNGLTPDMKEKVCGGAEAENTLNDDADDDADRTGDDEMVSFTRVYYWKARQDPDEVYLDKIGTLVYVKGIDDPVIDEDFKGQKWDEETKSLVGLTIFPLRIGTLTYISDKAVPPSDSEMGRPQVDEKMRSRSQMILQRDRSAPMRWANANRVDPMILQSLVRGDDYQRIIPVNGDGSAAIGEVARANYPSENWDFDRVIDKDLGDSWQAGPNQTGNFNAGGRTAAEANIVQGNYATRQAKERAKVAKFFCGIAEAVCGWMQMYYDGPSDAAKEQALLGDDVNRLQAWDRTKVSGAKFVFNIREDSTVKLDSMQQSQRVERFLNIAGKSGFANVQYLVEELASLSGLDTTKATMKPSPKAPEPPNVSLRAGGEDLRDPIVGPYLIALMQQGHPVQPTDIEAAKMLLIKSSSGPDPVPPPPPPGAGAPPPGQGAPPPSAPQPPKDYGPMERVTKRINEPGG
jgi:hypothetical protein